MDEKVFAGGEPQEQEARDDGAIGLSEVLGGALGETDNARPQGEAQQAVGLGQTAEETRDAREDETLEQARASQTLEQERAQWRAKEAEYQARIARLSEGELDREAEKLAAAENISKNIALRLLRAERRAEMKTDNPAIGGDDSRGNVPPRDEKGRFVSPGKPPDEAASDPVRERAAQLMAQNQVLLKSSGINALELYQNNDKVRAKVNSGEWDFADVARAYLKETGGGMYRNEKAHEVGAGGGVYRDSKTHQGVLRATAPNDPSAGPAESHFLDSESEAAPSPVRTANSGRIARKSFMDMTSEEFEAFNRRLATETFDASR